MGDSKPRYSPAYHTIKDSIYGYEFAPCVVRECKEPRVLRKFGKNGTCHVSIYTCKKCKYHITTPFCGAIGCGYKEDNNVTV